MSIGITKQRTKKTVFLILIFAIMIRLFTFIVILVRDSTLWVEASSLLPRGINPYKTDIDFFYKYPPLFYYLISFFGVVTNFTYLGPKLMVFVFDILNIGIIFFIGKKLKNESFGLKIMSIYALNPVIILQFYADTNEFVTLFFTLLAIYFLIDKKILFTAISLALGITFKLYPIFFLIPITIYLYRNLEKKSFQRLALFYFYLLFSILILVLPFLILSPLAFIEKSLIHASRMNKGNSLTELLPSLLYLYKPVINIFGITFSFQFLIQIGILGLSFVFFLVSQKKFDFYNLLIAIVLISYILPLINYQIQLKYIFLIPFPFILLIIYSRSYKFEELELYKIFLLDLISFSLLILIYIFLYPPLGNLINPSMRDEKIPLLMIIWIIDTCLIIINDYLRKEGDFMIYILGILPFMVYYFILNFIGAILCFILLVVNVSYFIAKYWQKW